MCVRWLTQGKNKVMGSGSRLHTPVGDVFPSLASVCPGGQRAYIFVFIFYIWLVILGCQEFPFSPLFEYLSRMNKFCSYLLRKSCSRNETQKREKNLLLKLLIQRIMISRSGSRPPPLLILGSQTLEKRDSFQRPGNVTCKALMRSGVSLSS